MGQLFQRFQRRFQRFKARVLRIVIRLMARLKYQRSVNRPIAPYASQNPSERTHDRIATRPTIAPVICDRAIISDAIPENSVLLGPIPDNHGSSPVLEDFESRDPALMNSVSMKMDRTLIDSDLIDSGLIDSGLIDSGVIDSELIDSELMNPEVIDPVANYFSEPIAPLNVTQLDYYRQKLLSDNVQYWDPRYDLISRLQAIGTLKVVNAQHADAPLSADIDELIASGFQKIQQLGLQLRSLLIQKFEEPSEYHLLKQFLRFQYETETLGDFDYVIAHEWVVHYQNPETGREEGHRGDLVLMNDRYEFAVVELKCINLSYQRNCEEMRSQARRRRCVLNRKRYFRSRLHKVMHQAQKYGQFFSWLIPWAQVSSYAVTDRAIYRAADAQLLEPVNYGATLLMPDHLDRDDNIFWSDY